MFVHNNPKWRRFPARSKLLQLVRVATGDQFTRRMKVTKAMFIGTVFRCTLSELGPVGFRYSIIENLKEKLAGSNQ